MNTSSRQLHSQCPSCDAEIRQEHVNVSEGVAVCPSCSQVMPLSQLNFTGVSIDDVLTTTPPRGEIYMDGDEMTVRFSLCSPLQALFVLGAMLFWNGILSLFLSLAVAAVFYNLTGSVPDWVPDLATEDGIPIMNGSPMGPGITIGLCLFLTPFVVIGLGMCYMVFLKLFGTTVIRIGQMESSASTGIGCIRRRKSFSSREVTSIRTITHSTRDSRSQTHLIEVLSAKPVKFGRDLTVDQMEWLAVFLRAVFLFRKSHTMIQRPTWLS